MVGSKKVMTHAERQAYWRDSEMGKKLGLSKLIIENSSKY